MSGTRIVIFAKAPVPGRVKTRLIPALGPEGAAALARDMLLATWRAAESVTTADTELCLSPDPDHPDWEGLLPPGASPTAQGEGDLGERLARAARRVASEGDRVIFVGTDCPALTASRLEGACRELERHDAVIHPAHDGGYVLLGLKRADDGLFRAIPWSTPSVARETIARIGALGWSLHVGETFRDVDEPDDLQYLPGRE